MKIPKKVKVGGKNYSIEIVDRVDGKDEFLGETTHSDLVIKVKRSKQAMMEETLLHEVLHCINGSWSEEFICGLSGDIHAFIIDNPKIFK